MCLKGTKEHEAIVATAAAPRAIHTGLLLTGAEPGHPVEFAPKFEPPTGTAIAIEFRWAQDGDSRNRMRGDGSGTTRPRLRSKPTGSSPGVFSTRIA